VDLARAFAERLGVALELVVFDAAGKSVEALTVDSCYASAKTVRGTNPSASSSRNCAVSMCWAMQHLRKVDGGTPNLRNN
jgi:hypothetical protein